MPRANRAAAALVVVANVLACTTTPNTPSHVVGTRGVARDAKEQLAQAEQRWATNRAAEYDFSVHVGCFCFLPLTLTFHVRDGVSSAPGLDAATRARVTNFESIESLFGLLREHLQRNPARFEVEYDQVLGYPTRADLDLSSRVADDELRFEITEFRLAR